ncbi:MAG: acetate kinase [Verrucomicrobiota bacterium]|nr:acetate kinase [Verrucomicrobiota bacterium]
MKVLVANLGSTSYKYRLFQMDGTDEVMLAKGGYERVTDFGSVIEDSIAQLIQSGHLKSVEDLDAVGFKAVLGKDLSGCVVADERCLKALDDYREVAPAHNPAYANGIRQFSVKAPKATLVALFETAFYQWAGEAACRYAVPAAWHAIGIRRYGFHGASHKFIAERSAELAGRDDVADRVRQLYVSGPGAEPAKPFRVISCHLGGSSSITGIRSGVAIGNSLGFSPQSGVPHNNRVGDLDAMAVPYAMKTLGLSVAEVERQLGKEGGFLGLSGGVGNDIRDIKKAAAEGNAQAKLALEVFVHEIRRWAGSFYFQLGGAEAIVFTGGIGENNPDVRAAICANLGELGITLDPVRNEATRTEGRISADSSRTQVWVIPTNEELVVAREVKRLLENRKVTH